MLILFNKIFLKYIFTQLKIKNKVLFLKNKKIDLYILLHILKYVFYIIIKNFLHINLYTCFSYIFFFFLTC